MLVRAERVESDGGAEGRGIGAAAEGHLEPAKSWCASDRWDCGARRFDPWSAVFQFQSCQKVIP
jgi:hypothetical protein